MSFVLQEERSSHSYRTEIPNILFDLDLDIYEFRVYLQLKKIAGDQSSCFQSNANLAKACGISEKKIRLIKKSLAAPREKLGGLALIRIRSRTSEKGCKESDLVTITNIWDLNFQIFFSPVPHTGGVRYGIPEGPVHGTDKEDPFKKYKSTLKGVPKNNLKSAPKEYIHPKIQEIKIPKEDQILLSQYPEHAIVSAIEDVKWYRAKNNKIKNPTSFMHDRIRHHAEKRPHESR